MEESKSWKGILVEPSRILFPTLQSNRPNSICYCCALGAFNENNTYLWGDFDGDPASSVFGKRSHRKPKEKVLVRCLQAILDENNITRVNFFSLDTEGYELNILNGIDFNKTIFDYILVEIYIDEFNEVCSLLESNNFELVENFSNYNPITNPNWDGTHNDYLFRRKNL